MNNHNNPPIELTTEEREWLHTQLEDGMFTWLQLLPMVKDRAKGQSLVNDIETAKAILLKLK